MASASAETAAKAANSQSFAARMRHLSIRARVILLVVMVLVGICGTSYILLSVFKDSAKATKREADLFSTYETASRAVRSFGELKYWLTDVAVSQLMNSERNAAAAQSRFRDDLAALRPIDPAGIDAVGGELDALTKSAGAAADAYAADKRVVGNSLMADARRHLGAIDAKLGALEAQVSAQSAQARELMVEATDKALVWLLLMLAVALLAGFVATVGLLRTISRPLQTMHKAVIGLTAGDLDVTIPTDAPKEVAAVGHALHLFRDSIGERNRLAAIEHKQRQILSTAIETIGEGFALFDNEGCLIVSNTRLREIFPHARNVFVAGARYADVMRAIDADWRAADGAQDDSATAPASRQGVREVAYDGRWVRISERHATSGETVVVFLDVTEQKIRETEIAAARDLAEQANVSKSQFIANMSHELRTPLNAIIGYSEMIKEDTEGLVDDEVHKDLDKIRNSGKHLLALINDVLDLSKIEAGKMQLEFEWIDIPALLDEIAATIKPLVDRNKNRFEVNRPQLLEPLWADAIRLKQSLLNLLSNASKFTQEGQIVLNLRYVTQTDGRKILFEVRDSGIGIPTEKLDKLFMEFSQVDASTTRKYGGTGLGLAISRHFCRMMGGDIVVESTPGVGSTFTIVLPSRQKDLAADSADAAEPLKASLSEIRSDKAEGGTILVIDDVENDRSLLRRYLEREGFHVVTAASGVEGLALLRERRFTAVTLDVKMDYVDGWTVLAAIRGDPKLADIPVIMVSVLDEVERGRSMGAAGFVTKPVDPGRLVPILEQIAGSPVLRDALVVDDDEASRTMLRRTLEAGGWRVREAGDGKAALTAVTEAAPDLILLDLMMPETDGFEVFETLRSDPSTADIPVLICTAKDLSDSERLRLGGGIVGVLKKGAYSREDFKQIVAATKQALVAKRHILQPPDDVAEEEGAAKSAPLAVEGQNP